MRDQQHQAPVPRFVLIGALTCFGGAVSAACPPGMVLLYGQCQKAQMSAQTTCSYQVTNANPQLISSNAPGSKEKLQALIAECVKNHEQQQAQATQKERQSSWQASPGTASSSRGAAAPRTAGARSTAGVPQSNLPAVQAPAQVDPTAAAKPLPDVPLACSVNSMAMKYGGGIPQRQYEIVARNDSGASLAAAYRIVWAAKKASPSQMGDMKLRAPLAASASIKIGTAVQPAGLPELTACEAVARF